MRIFKGVPYPIKKTINGFLGASDGINQIKADMLVLLLTNPGERVMNPSFGTPLKTLFFDQNDMTLQLRAKNMIINSLNKWEPRIAVQNIEVYSKIDDTSLNKSDRKEDLEHILFIRIIFVDPQEIKEVQELVLEVPLGVS